MSEYRRGYWAGWKRSRTGPKRSSRPGRPRLAVVNSAEYERGYARGLVAVHYVRPVRPKRVVMRDDGRLRCMGCRTLLLVASADGLCGFCAEELAA